MGGATMIDPAEFLKWLQVFGVETRTSGDVTPLQVQRFAFNAGTATGVNDAFIINLSPAVTALTNGLMVIMNSGLLENDTQSPTLQINALAPVPISIFAGAPAPGDIMTGEIYIFIYNSDLNVFELMNPSTSSANTFLVQQNVYNLAIDTGVVNAYIGNILPAPLTFNTGYQVFLQVANSNTGAATLTSNGNTRPIVTALNTPLVGGEIVAGSISRFFYSSSYNAYILMNPVNLGAILARSIQFTSTTGIIGTTTNNNAAAGSVGEYRSTIVVSGSQVSLTDTVSTTIASISLTSGDWDIWGQVNFNPSAGTIITYHAASISTTSGAIAPVPADNESYVAIFATAAAGNGDTLPIAPARISISGTTTMYLIARSFFSVSTNFAFGKICARRVR